MRRDLIIAVGFFMAGSTAQFLYDKARIRSKVPALMEKHLPDAAKLRAAKVHNLHMEEWARSIHDLCELYTGYLEDEFDAEELERRIEEMANGVDDRFEFIKTVVMY